MTLLELVDVLGDHEHVGIGAFEIVAVRVILGRDGEDLVEEERVLEASLDGLDEEAGEVPGVRPAAAKGLAFVEVGAKDWLEFLETQDRAVVASAVSRVDLLDARDLPAR